jgi:hypothetical protein
VSGPVKRSGTSFEVDIGTFIVVFLGVLLLLSSLAVFGMVKLSNAMEERERARLVGIRTKCTPVDTFAVREMYHHGYKNREISYRIMRYERFRCPLGDIQTLRTYISEDNSTALNLPQDVPELPVEPKPSPDTALTRSLDSGLSVLLPKNRSLLGANR